MQLKIVVVSFFAAWAAAASLHHKRICAAEDSCFTYGVESAGGGHVPRGEAGRISPPVKERRTAGTASWWRALRARQPYPPPPFERDVAGTAVVERDAGQEEAIVVKRAAEPWWTRTATPYRRSTSEKRAADPLPASGCSGARQSNQQLDFACQADVSTESGKTSQVDSLRTRAVNAGNINNFKRQLPIEQRDAQALPEQAPDEADTDTIKRAILQTESSKVRPVKRQLPYEKREAEPESGIVRPPIPRSETPEETNGKRWDSAALMPEPKTEEFAKRGVPDSLCSLERRATHPNGILRPPAKREAAPLPGPTVSK